MFQDYLVYATDLNTHYAFRVVHLSHLVQDAVARHRLTGARAECLGEALVCGILLSSLLEQEERVNLRLQMGSSFTLATETTRHAETRGYLETPEFDEFFQNLQSAAKGQHDVIVRSLRSLSSTSKLTEGITQCRFESVSEAVADHLKHSFQVGSRLKASCWVDDAGQLRAYGVVYLDLPGMPQQIGKELDSTAALFHEFSEFAEHILDDPDQLLKILSPRQFRVVNSVVPEWKCTCSQAGIEDMLLSLGQRELLEMGQQTEPTKITCHFCSTEYIVPSERIQELALSKVSADEANESGYKAGQPN